MALPLKWPHATRQNNEAMRNLALRTRELQQPRRDSATLPRSLGMTLLCFVPETTDASTLGRTVGGA
jgi:hypothetical protein